jgi:2-polyprenyl-3-methyl-5-hydroxy-6-metoxy-1,4-benzoquinol methylase
MIINKLNLNEKSQIIEIGSNDGFLLQFFAQKSIPVLGIEPAANVATEAIKKGITTIIQFFGLETAKNLLSQNKHADLVIANNVLAQVPDLNEFVAGMKSLLKPSGIITVEFHHILNLIGNNQFDTISHERFYHFSLSVIERVFASHGLTIFDVEEIPTHGGSLRIYASHTENKSISVSPKVGEIKAKEKEAGLFNISTYLSFAEKVKATKRNILYMLIDLKRNNKSIVGYGAHAEAHTFLNYCGLSSDFLDYTADRNPFKHGKFLAGVRIPIFSPDKIKETKPDYVLVLPWAIKSEIMSQMSYIGEWVVNSLLQSPR